MKRAWIGILCALALMLSLAGCGASGASANSSAAIAPQEATGEAGAMDTESGGTSLSTESSAGLLPQDGRKIILNATLDLEALDFDATCDALMQAVENAGGYVASTSVNTPAYEGALRSAYYQFRIPTDQYNAFLQSADGAGNLVSKQESTDDVTSAYVDVEARLASLRLQEERLFAMMEQSGDLETLLAIQNQLTEVQYQIESYTAQQRTYDDLIAYSTVDVTVSEVRQITEKAETFGDRVAEAFSRSWRNFGYVVQDFAVGVVGAFPTLLVLAVIAAVAFAIVRAASRRHKKALAARPVPAPRTPAEYSAPNTDATSNADAPSGKPDAPSRPKYQ